MKFYFGMYIVAATIIVGCAVLSLAPSGGSNSVVTTAEAHRTHSERYVAGKMREYIREKQCKGSLQWYCDMTITPIPIPFGRHAWRWNGDYYFRAFGGSTAICYTSGVYADHDIYWTNGVLMGGEGIYQTTKSGPHC